MKALASSQRFKFIVFFIFIYLIMFVFKDKLNVTLYQDEFHFFETTQKFSNYIIPPISYLEHYPELNTPLPFMIGGWWINLWGDTIQNLRILTFLLSFAIIALFIWESPKESNKLWVCVLGLWLFPNYYLCTVYYYTDMFAILFLLGGIISYLQGRHFLSGFLMVLAICCRQYMIAFPIAILANEVVGIFLSQRYSLKKSLKELLSKKYLMVYILAFLSIIPWVILWGGFAPADEMKRQHYDSTLTYKGGFVLYSSAVVAFYFVIPEILLMRKINVLSHFVRSNRVVSVLCLLVVGFLVCFTPAVQTYNPYFTWKFLGYLDMGLVKIGVPEFIKQIIFGLLMFLALIRFLSGGLNISTWVFIINGILLGKAQLSWDKYSLPTVVILWFLVLVEEKYFNQPSNLDKKYEISHV
ncbi:hypothetical protein [Flectobacillus rivi]|uniref:Glycosyltransferase RgtA/B/C/D-like domain-containing protein n=1 Tax=Flectobacillus rivi TaxID=2984209 RepID=A0ABT6YZK8_9BACT|nr:hypothetical protein [Flectobacillus rivi]MDI9874311.1 hypothetical protein [Flectobacillus rivi]